MGMTEDLMKAVVVGIDEKRKTFRKYCPMTLKCLDIDPRCESCKKPFRVDLVESDGWEWEHVPQGFFDTKEEAFALREKLIKDGFEYVAVVHNTKTVDADGK